jgi:2-amino-4-hydroxy-6-hydroxymethyldihydropteridine diphosphokinase
VKVIVGLGGNRGAVEHAFAAARATLAERFTVHAASSLWRSAAVGPAQPDFLNAALLVGADAHPMQLLAVCLLVEAAAGRDRRSEARWGPRPLDLDLLAAERCVIEAPALRLPHPRLAARRFAVLPAAELAPDWRHPRLHRTLADLAADPGLAAQRCDRVGPFPPPLPGTGRRAPGAGTDPDHREA